MNASVVLYTLIHNRGLAHEMRSITKELKLTEKRYGNGTRRTRKGRGNGSITKRAVGVHDTFILMQKRRFGAKCSWLSSCPSYYHLPFCQSEKLHCDRRPPRSSDFS